jgi:CRISPR-associated protein Cas1
MSNRLFIKVTRDNLPQVKDKYPYIYLEHGRLEIDGSSVKWIDAECNIVRIPCATLNAILLGPGTSVTHEAIKIIAASNCYISWVGEDSLIFYAVGQSPTANTRNLRQQMFLASNLHEAESVARRMFLKRFSNMELENKTINEMRGMEGARVRKIYEQMAKKYNIVWNGRRYKQGHFELGSITNQFLTCANSLLYGILSALIHSMGYSPHIGFIHSGCPLPFVYDIADLYKEYLCIDLAFALTVESEGKNDRKIISSGFKNRIIETDLLGHIGDDIKYVLGEI